jgi:hypothetical protein
MAAFQAAADFQEARLRVVSFEPPARIDRFASEIDMRGMVYERLYGPWRSIFAQLEPFDRQPFTQLEITLRQAGDDTAADEVYYALRTQELRNRFRRSAWRLWPGIAWDLFLRYLAGYGVRPVRLFVILGTFLTLGTIAFRQPGAVVQEEPLERILQHGHLEQLGWGQALLVSIDQVLPIVEIPSAREWLPSERTWLILGPVELTYTGVATVLTLFGLIVGPAAIAIVASWLWRQQLSKPLE